MRHLSNDKTSKKPSAPHLSYLGKGRVSVETPPEAPSLHQPSPSLCCAESSPASASESLQTAQTHTQCGTICEISKPFLYAAIYVLSKSIQTIQTHTVDHLRDILSFLNVTYPVLALCHSDNFEFLRTGHLAPTQPTLTQIPTQTVFFPHLLLELHIYT